MTFTFVLPDLDECMGDGNNCNPNADCINTVGSYLCQCRVGYEGDGFTCNGKLQTRWSHSV